MTRVSELSAGRPVRRRWLTHLLLTVCLLAIAEPVAALLGARMQVEVDAQQTYDSPGHDYDAVTTEDQRHPCDGDDGHDAVHDGVTHLFAGMVDARVDPDWRNATKGGENAAGVALLERRAS